MFLSKEAKSAADIILDAKKILIIPFKSSLDAYCAATGLFKTLKVAGKNVSFAYSQNLNDAQKEVLSETELSTLPQSRDLVINIDYTGTEIEKINYFVEGSNCKIVIHPVSKEFNTEKINYEKTGFDYDLVITIGASSFEEIVREFPEYEEDLSKTFMMNIDNSRKNQNFASLNIIEPDHETLSQLMLNKLVIWKYKVNSDAAKALLKGVSSLPTTN